MFGRFPFCFKGSESTDLGWWLCCVGLYSIYKDGYQNKENSGMVFSDHDSDIDRIHPFPFVARISGFQFVSVSLGAAISVKWSNKLHMYAVCGSAN